MFFRPGVHRLSFPRVNFVREVRSTEVCSTERKSMDAGPYLFHFSNTYNNIHLETDRHSKFQFYNMTKEYFNRPLLPPPFIFITHVHRFIRVVLHFHSDIRWESLQMGNSWAIFKETINLFTFQFPKTSIRYETHS